MTNPINYNPNYPEIESTWADWQVQFIQNFEQLGLAFSQNHVPLNDPTIANRGNHTIIQMPELLNPPQTGSTEFSIHTKNVEGQTAQVYFTYPGNAPVVQFTNYQIYSVLPTAQQTTFFTFLPGGILIYFGGFGPFIPTNGNNTIFLNPPVTKSVRGVQFALSGSTPDYTPAFVTKPPDSNGIIDEIYVIPTLPQKVPQAVFYMVIANI